MIINYLYFLIWRKIRNFITENQPVMTITKMSQGQVNDIKNNAQFLGFKNDRGVIPLCYDFPCKFIKIKWELRRCWLKKLYSSLFSLARPLSKNDTGGQNGPCFCFPQTVICYLLSVPQKIHLWKLSTVKL